MNDEHVGYEQWQVNISEQIKGSNDEKEVVCSGDGHGHVHGHSSEWTEDVHNVEDIESYKIDIAMKERIDGKSRQGRRMEWPIDKEWTII